MKPTKAQKEVINAMRNGYQLTEYFTGNSFMLIHGNSVKHIKYVTYENLRAMGLVDCLQNSTLEYIYFLTELGKTIEL